MIENPFLEATFYASNDKLRENLNYAAIMWAILTEKKAPNDDIIGQILFGCRLDGLWIAYQFQKQNWDGFDKDAFSLLVKTWACIYNE